MPIQETKGEPKREFLNLEKKIRAVFI